MVATHVCFILTALCSLSQHINISIRAQTSKGQRGRGNPRERVWHSGGQGGVDSRDTASFHVQNIFEPQRASGHTHLLGIATEELVQKLR